MVSVKEGVGLLAELSLMVQRNCLKDEMLLAMFARGLCEDVIGSSKGCWERSELEMCSETGVTSWQHVMRTRSLMCQF